MGVGHTTIQKSAELCTLTVHSSSWRFVSWIPDQVGNDRRGNWFINLQKVYMNFRRYGCNWWALPTLQRIRPVDTDFHRYGERKREMPTPQFWREGERGGQVRNLSLHMGREKSNSYNYAIPKSFISFINCANCSR